MVAKVYQKLVGDKTRLRKFNGKIQDNPHFPNQDELVASFADVFASDLDHFRTDDSLDEGKLNMLADCIKTTCDTSLHHAILFKCQMIDEINKPKHVSSFKKQSGDVSAENDMFPKVKGKNNTDSRNVGAAGKNDIDVKKHETKQSKSLRQAESDESTPTHTQSEKTTNPGERAPKRKHKAHVSSSHEHLSNSI
jgi:hypothetical protein